MFPRLEKEQLYTSCSLREHPVFSAPVWWFHIRIHNRQSLKYYRLSQTSWKIHKNIARLPFDACWVFLTRKLPILSSTHLPPYFPTRWRKIHAKTRALLLRIGEVNCDWSLTADVTEIFLSFRFRRRFFSAGKTKAEKTGCSRRLNHSLQIIVYITFLYLVKRHWLNCSDWCLYKYTIIQILFFSNMIFLRFFFLLKCEFILQYEFLDSLNKSFWHKNN